MNIYATKTKEGGREGGKKGRRGRKEVGGAETMTHG